MAVKFEELSVSQQIAVEEVAEQVFNVAIADSSIDYMQGEPGDSPVKVKWLAMLAGDAFKLYFDFYEGYIFQTSVQLPAELALAA
jgi:hypothetical protein